MLTPSRQMGFRRNLKISNSKLLREWMDNGNLHHTKGACLSNSVVLVRKTNQFSLPELKGGMVGNDQIKKMEVDTLSNRQ